MDNLLVVFCASAFALSAASAPAQGLSADNDMKPPSKMEAQGANAAAAAAKAKWAAMTPEQQAAAKKAARAKKQAELTWTAIGDFPTRPEDPGYFPPMTPEQREAATRKAAVDAETRLKKQAEQQKVEHP